MQPFYTTLGTEGQRPDGCHRPLCAAGAGTYRNTGKHHLQWLFPRSQGCMVFTAKGGIKNGVRKGAVPPQWNGTSYLPRAEPSTRPGGVSRSRTEPLAPRAKGPAAPSTLTPVRACQPSGIQSPASNDTDFPYVSSSWLMTRFFVFMKFGATRTTSTRAMRA